MGDPVPAIAEHEATGETARIFEDMRETLGIPVVNLIWRHLATIPGGLEWAWASAKPIYASGAARGASKALQDRLAVPMPEPLIPGALRLAGVGDANAQTARAVVAAYDKGNGLNLTALTALVVAPAGPAPVLPTEPDRPGAPVPRVLSESDVDADTWRMVLALNELGARPEEPILATMYRHLAYWPGLLGLMQVGFAPLERSGALRRSIGQARDIARAEAARLAQLRADAGPGPEPAVRAIETFADHVICRMVPICLATGRWIDAEQVARQEASHG